MSWVAEAKRRWPAQSAPIEPTERRVRRRRAASHRPSPSSATWLTRIQPRLRPRNGRRIAVHQRRPEELEAPGRLRQREEADDLDVDARPASSRWGSRSRRARAAGRRRTTAARPRAAASSGTRRAGSATCSRRCAQRRRCVPCVEHSTEHCRNRRRATISRAEVRRMAIVVQKYGGSSVADVERIQKVADRVAATRGRGQGRGGGGLGHGRHHRRAARPWPGSVTREPRRGASWTCCSPPASASRWRCSRWRSTRAACPPSASPARSRHHHQRRAHQRAHRRGAAVPHPGRAGARQGRDRRRLPGRLLQARGHDAGPRRLGHHRGGAGRGARRRGLRDLQRRRRRLHRRPARGARGARGWPRSPTRRCRSWPRPARRC